MSNTGPNGEQLWAVEIKDSEAHEFVGYFVVWAAMAEGRPDSAVSKFYDAFPGLPSPGVYVVGDVLPFEEVFGDSIGQETTKATAQALADALKEEQRHNQALESHLLSLQDTLAGAISDTALALQR